MKSDSTLIDTFKTYWRNEKIQQILVYDSNGILNGQASMYDSNGNALNIINFKNDIPYGYGYEYYSNGNLKSKFYLLGDGQVGNTYHFDQQGQKTLRQYYLNYFIDSILPSSDNNYINIGFIVAKPPRELIDLTLYKIDTGGKIFDSLKKFGQGEIDTISIQLENKLSSLKWICRRYDSILSQSTIEYGDINIEDQ